MSRFMSVLMLMASLGSAATRLIRVQYFRSVTGGIIAVVVDRMSGGIVWIYVRWYVKFIVENWGSNRASNRIFISGRFALYLKFQAL